MSSHVFHVLTAFHRLGINRTIVVKWAASAWRRKRVESVYDRGTEGEALLLLGLPVFHALAWGQEGKQLAKLALLGLGRLRPRWRERTFTLLAP